MLIKTREAYRECPAYNEKRPIPICDLCGEAIIAYPFIVWMTAIDFMQLHVDCAANFLLALSRDVHEYKVKMGKHLEFT